MSQIITKYIADLAVTTAKIDATAVTTAKLGTAAVTAAKADLTTAWDFSPTASALQAATPVNDADVAIKGYVDGVVQGLDVKGSVVATTTANGALTTAYENLDVIDGVTLATGDRILLKDQTTGTENGIYTVNATGAPTRATDFATAATVSGAFCFVEEGTVNAENGFTCTNNTGSDVVGTAALVFAQFSGAGQITAGAGMTKTGNTLDVIAATNGGMTINANDIEIKADSTTGATVAPIGLGANGAGIVIDNSTLAHTTGTIRVATDGITATELLLSATYDFATETGIVNVTTQTAGNNTTLAASTAFVTAAVAASGEVLTQEEHLITSGEDTLGLFSIASTPANASNVQVHPVGGPAQRNKQVSATAPDFDVLNSTEIHFNNNGAAVGLSALMAAGDTVLIVYAV